MKRTPTLIIAALAATLALWGAPALAAAATTPSVSLHASAQNVALSTQLVTLSGRVAGATSADKHVTLFDGYDLIQSRVCTIALKAGGRFRMSMYLLNPGFHIFQVSYRLAGVTYWSNQVVVNAS
jgi:hypothetical protein